MKRIKWITACGNCEPCLSGHPGKCVKCHKQTKRWWEAAKLKAYKAGRLAYGEIGEASRNPHPYESELQSQWNRGYFDAKDAWELLYRVSNRDIREFMAAKNTRSFVDLYDKTTFELEEANRHIAALKQTIKTLLNDRKI